MTPTIVHHSRRAWALELPPDASMAACAWWLLELPGDHAVWRHWSVSLIALIDVEGMPPQQVIIPGASHELVIVALDSSKDPRPDQPGAWVPLRPLDLVQQFGPVSDGQAVELAKSMVAKAVLGGVPVDSDFRASWESWIRVTATELKRTGGAS